MIDTYTSKLYKGFMPVHDQRHHKIIEFIANNDLTGVIDIGCNTGDLIRKISRSSTMRSIIGLDLDEEALSAAKENIVPEFLQASICMRRDEPCVAKIYKGDALQSIPATEEIELAIMTEFIEHVEEKDLPKISQNVFGKLRPNFVAVTTPNFEFNVLFENKEKKFRHDDHRFEWTRDQFKNYCDKNAEKYGYTYELFGVGEPRQEENKSKYGYLSQGAFFKRIKEDRGKVDYQGLSKKCELMAEQVYKPWKQNFQKNFNNAIEQTIRRQGPISFGDLIKRLKSMPEGKKVLEKKIQINKEYLLDSMDCFYYEVYECASQNCERLIERKKYEDEDEVYYSYFEEGDYLTEEEQEYEAEMGEQRIRNAREIRCRKIIQYDWEEEEDNTYQKPTSSIIDEEFW